MHRQYLVSRGIDFGFRRMEGVVYFFQTNLTGIVSSIWSSVFPLAGLWLFSIFCLRILQRFPKFSRWQSGLQQEKLEVKKELERKKQPQNTMKVAAPSVANAEEFVKLFEAWLCAEDVENGTHQSIGDYTKKLQDAGKEVQQIHLVIESFQMKRRLGMESYDPQLNKEAARIKELTDRFEYVKTYVEMRLFLLKTLLKMLETSMAQQKEVKMWMEKMQALQEKLHAVPCDADTVIESHLEQQKTIIEEAHGMEAELHKCQETVSELTALLKEIGIWTAKFTQTVHHNVSLNGSGKWNELLIDSLAEELQQVNQQFAAVSKITACYVVHLEDLQLLSQWGQVAQQHRRRPSDIQQMCHSVVQQLTRKTSSLKLKRV